MTVLSGTSSTLITLTNLPGNVNKITEVTSPVITAVVNTTYSAITVQATDFWGNGVPNVDVLYIAPSAAPTATFSSGSQDAAVTDSNGDATSSTLFADTLAGTFQVLENAQHGILFPQQKGFHVEHFLCWIWFWRFDEQNCLHCLLIPIVILFVDRKSSFWRFTTQSWTCYYQIWTTFDNISKLLTLYYIITMFSGNMESFFLNKKDSMLFPYTFRSLPPLQAFPASPSLHQPCWLSCIPHHHFWISPIDYRGHFLRCWSRCATQRYVWQSLWCWTRGVLHLTFLWSKLQLHHRNKLEKLEYKCCRNSEIRTIGSETVAGSYVVTVSTSGAPSQAAQLTNTPGTASVMNNLGGSGQSTFVTTAFTIPLQVTTEKPMKIPLQLMLWRKRKHNLWSKIKWKFLWNCVFFSKVLFDRIFLEG